MSDYLLLLLPGALIGRLSEQAAVAGTDPGDLVVDILVDELPPLLAHAARVILAAHISARNQQGPTVLIGEALNDEDFSQANVEPNYTARHAIEGVSGDKAD